MTSDAWYAEPLRPLEGGDSGETFLGELGPDRTVVRIYTRDPARAAIDASLLRLVRGLVPVPEVLELRRPTADTPAILVTEYVAGIRLDTALATEPDRLDLTVVGRSVGRILNTLTGMPFLRAGTFADADLALSDLQLPSDLQQWADGMRPTGRLATWAQREWDGLLSLIDTAEAALEDDAARRVRRTVMVHSDVNPKNILIDPATSQVVALLDWEYAHAGSRYTDLGNFMRFEREPRLVEALLATLSTPLDDDPTDLQRLGRAMDLWALIELAGRPQPSPVQTLAAELLLAQARSGDLDAWPWATSRVHPPPG